MIVRTGLIGCGRIGWSLEMDPLRYHPCTHGGSIRRLSGKPDPENSFQLLAVSDRNAGQLESFQGWWTKKGPQTFQDWKVMLKTIPLDFLVIATDPESHFEMAKFAIRCGVKTLLIEKPVTLDLKKAKALLKLARETETSVFINFERRFHPSYAHLHELIQNEKYGSLLSVRSRVLTGSGFDPSNGTGPLVHDAVHLIDLLVHWFGKPGKIQSRIHRYHVQGQPTESVHALIDYKPIVVHLESSGNRRYFEFELELDFKEGRVHAGNGGFFISRSTESSRYAGFRELEPIKKTEFPGFKNPWVEMYRFILSEISEQTHSIRMLEDAVTGLEIIEKIYRSI